VCDHVRSPAWAKYIANEPEGGPLVQIWKRDLAKDAIERALQEREVLARCPDETQVLLGAGMLCCGRGVDATRPYALLRELLQLCAIPAPYIQDSRSRRELKVKVV
jgi:hypothetical protein